MNPADNNQNNNPSAQPAAFNSADAPPPPMASANPMPSTPEPVTPPPSTTTPPSFEQGTPTVSAGGGSNKKIFMIIGIVILLLVLGVGAYLLASNFLFPQQEEPLPSATPIVEEEITALCLNIKAYDEEWNRLSLSDLSSLQPGDVVRFSVSGDTSSGSFDKAMFTVNSVSLGETTQLMPDSNEFYDEYIIPEGTSSFNVEAQIHHVQLDQWI